MEMTDFASHELARQLKAAGFDWHCRSVWHFDGEEWNFIEDYGATFLHPADIPHWNSSDVWGAHIFSAPTLAQTQKWMRTKGFAVEVSYVLIDGESGYDWNVIDMTYGDMVDCNIRASLNTYEAALADGISAALKLMKEGDL